MCYLKRIEYMIKPEGSYHVIRNCPKCGCKSAFMNTHCFRVNANGNQIDVWLIYQCEKCKQSYNLSIYERKRSSDIKKEEYKRFIENSKELAKEYGYNKEFFAMNKAVIDSDHISYTITKTHQKDQQSAEAIVIRNPRELKLRTDKVLSEIFRVSRSKVKKMVEESFVSEVPAYVSPELELILRTNSQTSNLL